MHALGTLEDLPLAYREALEAQNLVPLWPSLRAVMPPLQPQPRTKPTFWAYQTVRPLLLQAGELTPIEKAERRVLVLANPGHGLEKMQASASIYLGMQLLMPGEHAPSHRHTPNAIRMVIEGDGAYTSVDGEKCPMERGDMIMTPSGHWHEHGHEGKEPVIWLDVLDLPLAYYLEVSYVQEGSAQAQVGVADASQYVAGGILPTPMFERSKQKYPLMRYPWAHVKTALLKLAQAQPTVECVQVAYVNPETGLDCQNILGYSALMLRPGQRLTMPRRSCAMVLHQIEGKSQVILTDMEFTLDSADTCCIPGYSASTLVNRSATENAFVFIADEAPLQKKLGLYEVRAAS